MRIRLPAPFCTASSGGFGFPINTSPGLSRTGTLRCNSFLAIGAGVGVPPAGGAGTGGSEPVVTLPLEGIMMLSPQEGQSICEPAPDWSTASSWSQCGQLKVISIVGWLNRAQPKSNPPRSPEKNGGHESNHGRLQKLSRPNRVVHIVSSC